MKSARTLRILILASMMAPSTVVRGDTFFDFGLRWTQWVPNRGKIQKFERDDIPVVISVPTPVESNHTPNRPDPAPVSTPGSSNVSSPIGSGVRPYESGYSAPSNYVPAPVAPTYSAPATPVPSLPPVVSAPSVPAPVVSTPNVYPASMPPAANSGNIYPVSMPPAANYSPAAPVVSKDRFDALIRMDVGPYPLADKLVTGQPQAWYESPVVQSIYGGTPNDHQKRAFENDVLAKVRETYSDSGVSLNLTNDPSASAARTISVVSGASYGADSKVAGITVMNADGFSFIDKLDKAANVDDLEWAVARNVAHELLHAFNVGHHDQSGNYLDAAVANWDMLIADDTKFSEMAVADLRSKIAAGVPDSPIMGIGNFAQHLSDGSACAHCIAAQVLEVQPVPEPATIALWVVGASLLYRYHRKQRGRSVA